MQNDASKRERTALRMPELLAPAGGPEPFNAALAAGADAIYCGLGNDFNARRGAHNFTDETFAAACRRAHLAGARVYVTENVVIKTEEMPRALELIRRAWVLGADAFIIQDWGLMTEVLRRWPQIEVHVSTQANVHDARATRACKELGVQRVTLSRELSLDEMRTIAQEGVELEAFGHGAICFCYSGVCMMSSLAGGRSANRGLCAQPCRLPYDLVDQKGKAIEAPGRTRPLCPKDYYSFDDIEALAQAGVGSLKVEGRMKAPDYVYAVISAYRAQMDDIAAGRTPTKRQLASRRQTLKRAFNRDFTNAYLHGRSGDEMMSYDRSNNRGQLVGEVTSSRSLGTTRHARGGANGGRVRTRTYSRAEVTIVLREQVGAGDLLEVRPTDDPSQFLTTYAQADAPAGATIQCITARPMPVGSVVRVIRSQKIMDEAARAAKSDIPRKRRVNVQVEALQGNSFSVRLETVDGRYSAEATGFVVEPARTKAVTYDDLVEHVGRMGSSVFEPVSFDVALDDGCGMSFSAVHKVRAEACRRLEEAILVPYQGRGQRLDAVPDQYQIQADLREVRDRSGVRRAGWVTMPESEVCALVTTPECARAALDAGAKRLYATSDALEQGSWPEGVVPVLDEVSREADLPRLDPWVRPEQPVAVGNVSQLVLARQLGADAEIRTCIPVHNESCLVALEAAGAKGVWLSPELTLDESLDLARRTSVPLGMIVSGRPRAMTSEHCVLQAIDACIHDCPNCKLRQRRLSLRDRDGALLPVRTDVHGRSRIYASHPLDATPQIGDMLAAGITRFAADATLLSPQETAFAVQRIVRAVEAARQGKKPAPRLQGCTSGHLFSPIG